MWHMISVLIEADVKVSRRDIRWVPFQKKADAKMLAQGHNSSWSLHAFNAQNLLPTMRGLFSDLNGKLEMLSIYLVEHVPVC